MGAVLLERTPGKQVLHTKFAQFTGTRTVVVVDVDCCIIGWSDVDGVLDGPKGLSRGGSGEVVLAVRGYKKLRCGRASGVGEAGGDGEKELDHFLFFEERGEVW